MALNNEKELHLACKEGDHDKLSIYCKLKHVLTLLTKKVSLLLQSRLLTGMQRASNSFLKWART